MTTVWPRAALSAFTVLGAIAIQSTPSLANCDWYVKTALEQQQRNLKLKCGLVGRRMVRRQGCARDVVRFRQPRCLEGDGAEARGRARQVRRQVRPPRTVRVR